jgi:hypothetical protein
MLAIALALIHTVNWRVGAMLAIALALIHEF